MGGLVTKKNTRRGTKIKFIDIIRTKKRKAETPKSTKKIIVRSRPEKTFNR
jgi:hypothetical protein